MRFFPPSFPLSLNAAPRRGRVRGWSRGGGSYPPVLPVPILGLYRFVSSAGTEHRNPRLPSVLRCWSGPGVKLEPAENCPQWSGTERPPPPWTDELAEMSRHIYTRHGIGEALQKPVCQVGEESVLTASSCSIKAGPQDYRHMWTIPTHFWF